MCLSTGQSCEFSNTESKLGENEKHFLSLLKSLKVSNNKLVGQIRTG